MGRGDVDRIGAGMVAPQRFREPRDLLLGDGGELRHGPARALLPLQIEAVMADIAGVEPVRVGERVEQDRPFGAHRPERVDLRGDAGGDRNADLVLGPAHRLLKPVIAERQVQRHPAQNHDIDPGPAHFARRLQRHLDAAHGLLPGEPLDRKRGEHQRHPLRHHPVELAGKGLGQKRWRGIADPGAMAVHGGSSGHGGSRVDREVDRFRPSSGKGGQAVRRHTRHFDRSATGAEQPAPSLSKGRNPPPRVTKRA